MIIREQERRENDITIHGYEPNNRYYIVQFTLSVRIYNTAVMYIIHRYLMLYVWRVHKN